MCRFSKEIPEDLLQNPRNPSCPERLGRAWVGRLRARVVGNVSGGTAVACAKRPVRGIMGAVGLTSDCCSWGGRGHCPDSDAEVGCSVGISLSSQTWRVCE